MSIRPLVAVLVFLCASLSSSLASPEADAEAAWLARQREARASASAASSANEAALERMASELETALEHMESAATTQLDVAGDAATRDVVGETRFNALLDGVAGKGALLFVQFYAAWCGHCKSIAPVWARLATDYANDPRIAFVRVNGDDNDRLMARFGVKGFPNMLLFTKGNLGDGGELYKGYRTYDAMQKWLHDRIGAPMLTPVKKVAEYHARLAEFNQRNKDLLKQPTKPSVGAPTAADNVAAAAAAPATAAAAAAPDSEAAAAASADDGLLGSEDDAPFEPTDEGKFGLTNELYFQAWQLEQAADEKRVVLLLHDFGAHSSHWQPVVDYLYRRRFTLYAADLAAHGRSSGLRGSISSLAELADDVVALARRARRDEGVKEVLIVGHGLGALAALKAAAVAPRGIVGVVGIAPLLGGAAPLGGAASIWGAALGDVMAAVYPDFLVDRTVRDEQLLAGKTGLAAQLAADRWAHSQISAGAARVLDEVAASGRVEIAPAVRVPVLLVQGDADPIAPTSATQEFFESVGGAKVLLLVPGARHWPLHDAGAEQTLSSMSAWISDVFAAAAGRVKTRTA
jgi:alpha-beta hydrolase superfamily lysophospholipase/thiol-disulfide isomerase/thioredoxin